MNWNNPIWRTEEKTDGKQNKQSLFNMQNSGKQTDMWKHIYHQHVLYRDYQNEVLQGAGYEIETWTWTYEDLHK